MNTYFYHGPNVSQAVVMRPPISDVSDWSSHWTDENKHVPARPKAVHVGDEWLVLQALCSMKHI